MCHKYDVKLTSKQRKVTDKTGMEAYRGCAHGCINAAPRRQAFYHRSQSSLYKQGPRLICHVRPSKYYISGVLTVPQTLSNAQAEFIGWTPTPKPRHALAGSQHDSEKKPHPPYNPCYPERNMVLPSPT